ncbi:MAG TPA: chorismate mutase [Bryobacterales bacterium]|nr:chorismate mutase [Bryobacterales bacterium]
MSGHDEARLPPAECADMEDVRREIDRIDERMVELLAERFAYVDRAWQIKMGTQEGATVPWRIQQVIDRVRAKAEKQGLPPALAEALWRQMIGWFIQYEEERMKPPPAGDGD